MEKQNQQQQQGYEFSASEPSGVAERPPTESGAGSIAGKRVAVIISDGFEQTEFEVPTKRLREAGAIVEVLAQDEQHLAHIKGESQGEPAAGTQADKTLDQARPEDYDALLVPGGLKSPDFMRASEPHLAFVKAFVDAGKPIAAICHGPWLLADVGALEGRTVTSWPAIRQDVERAGATWKDQEVVEDGPFVFSRKPDDAEAFARTFISKVGAGVSR